MSGIGDFFKAGAEAIVDLAVEVVALPETIAQAIADKAAEIERAARGPSDD